MEERLGIINQAEPLIFYLAFPSPMQMQGLRSVQKALS
jgi:hypothetical protein